METNEFVALCLAIAVLGFAALWSQFGRRAAFHALAILAGLAAAGALAWLAAVVIKWMLTHPMAAVSFVGGFFFGAVAVLFPALLVAGDPNRDEREDTGE